MVCGALQDCSLHLTRANRHKSRTHYDQILLVSLEIFSDTNKISFLRGREATTASFSEKNKHTEEDQEAKEIIVDAIIATVF